VVEHAEEILTIAKHDVPPAGGEVERRLTPRESEVMSAVARGLTNQQTADRLEVSVHAVKFHLASIYRKLGVANRTEAAAQYLRTQIEAPR